jgi:hypothetical protein
MTHDQMIKTGAMGTLSRRPTMKRPRYPVDRFRFAIRTFGIGSLIRVSNLVIRI